MTSKGTFSVFDLTTTRVELIIPPELHCRQIEPPEIELVQKVMDKAGTYQPHEALMRLAQGGLAFVGEVDEKGWVPVTFGWVTYKLEPLGSTGIAFQPPPGDVYLYDFATLPDYRGRGYYPALLRFILGKLAERGVKRAWIGTAPGNDVSARSIQKAGFTEIFETNPVPGKDEQLSHFEFFPKPGVNNELIETGIKAHIHLAHKEQ